MPIGGDPPEQHGDVLAAKIGPYPHMADPDVGGRELVADPVRLFVIVRYESPIGDNFSAALEDGGVLAVFDSHSQVPGPRFGTLYRIRVGVGDNA